MGESREEVGEGGGKREGVKRAHLSCGYSTCRRPQDFYATPPGATRVLLDYEFLPGIVWEPSVGRGHITEVIKQYKNLKFLHKLISSDLYPSVPCLRKGVSLKGKDTSKMSDEELKKYFEYLPIPEEAVSGVDFLNEFDVSNFYKVSGVTFVTTVVTNPPFDIATSYIQRARELASQKVCLLMKLNHLAGVERYNKIYTEEKNKKFPLKRVIVLPGRLTFPGYHCSSTLEMAWFIWDKFHSGEPRIIHADPKSY